MGNKLKYTLDTIHVVSDHIKDLVNNYTIFLFEGDMGSGKTTLIKQIVKDIGISENVKSPTFSLVNEYIENDLIIFYYLLYQSCFSRTHVTLKQKNCIIIYKIFYVIGNIMNCI